MTSRKFSSHLAVGCEFFLAVLTAEWLLLAAVSGLVLAECHGGGEALLTIVAGENCIFLKNDIKKNDLNAISNLMDIIKIVCILNITLKLL